MDLTGLVINIRLVSDAVIRRFNRWYLRHDWATDVIAFPMESHGVLGDLMISTDMAKRQAKEEQHTVAREVLILAIHGILHLVGYRDKTPEEARRMWRKTNALLRFLRV